MTERFPVAAAAAVACLAALLTGGCAARAPRAQNGSAPSGGVSFTQVDEIFQRELRALPRCRRREGRAADGQLRLARGGRRARQRARPGRQRVEPADADDRRHAQAAHAVQRGPASARPGGIDPPLDRRRRAGAGSGRGRRAGRGQKRSRDPGHQAAGPGRRGRRGAGVRSADAADRRRHLQVGAADVARGPQVDRAP